LILRYKRTGSPVISDHRTSLNHEFNWEDVEILDNKPCYKKRIFEMIHIKKQKYSLNRQTDIDLLSDVYLFLLQSLPLHR